jgi:hypothetical protein
MASLTGTQHVKGFPASHHITLHRIRDHLSTPARMSPLTEQPVIGITNRQAVLRFKGRITSFDTWKKDQDCGDTQMLET